MAGLGPLSAGSMNVGKDIELIFTIQGQSFSYLGLLTETSRKPITMEHETTPTNNGGISVRRTTHHGFEFDFKITRQDGTYDALVLALLQNYQNGGAPESVQMYETIANPNTTVNQVLYGGGNIIPESMGSFKGAGPVDDISFRVKFSYATNVSGAASSFAGLFPGSGL